jgi:hypothetical protein
MPALLLQGLASPLLVTAGYVAGASAPTSTTPGRHTATDRPVHGTAQPGQVARYPLGAVVVLEDVIVDDTGNALTPATLTLTLTKADGTQQTTALGVLAALAPNHYALFYALLDSDPPGLWSYRFETTGTGAGADGHRFWVDA